MTRLRLARTYHFLGYPPYNAHRENAFPATKTECFSCLHIRDLGPTNFHYICLGTASSLRQGDAEMELQWCGADGY